MMTNPFDFGRPVSDPDLFAGRARELFEIGYYLDLACHQPSIGLAVVGERTSGKSSILNMANSMAIQKGFLTARYDLTDADVQSEENFLQGVYESLFLAAKERMFWEGKTAEVYDAFRDAMDARSAARLREYCDLSFPRSFASAATSGRSLTNFNVQLLINDLKSFLASTTIDTCPGIVILIDEGDHLAKLGVALEKLRWVMSNASQVLIVVAGTDMMLGRMNEVFAPIVRLFKRIHLKPFVSPSETRDCIFRRLERVGKDGLLTRTTYMTLHDLVQGQPYEAQLIAHHAYRRHMENPGQGFEITVTVLNDVLAEVERYRSDDRYRFTARLRSYTTHDLQELASVVLFPQLSLYEKAKIDTALVEPGRVKERISHRREELKKRAEHFRNDGVVVFNKATEAYELDGDQFDKLYAKLLARSHKVHWVIDDRPLVELTNELIANAMQNEIGSRPFPRFFIEGERLARPTETDRAAESMVFTETRYYQVLGEIASFIRSWEFRLLVRGVVGRLRKGDIDFSNVWLPTVIADAGSAAAGRSEGETIATVRVHLSHPKEGRETSVWLQPATCGVTTDEWREKVEDYLRTHALGMNALGWTAEISECEEEAIGDLDNLIDVMLQQRWRAVADHVSGVLDMATYRQYLSGDSPGAIKCAERGVRLGGEGRGAVHMNNVGYLRLHAGELSEALVLFDNAISQQASSSELPKYNRAVCLALLGRRKEARSALQDLHGFLTGERIDSGSPVTVTVLTSIDHEGKFLKDECREISLEAAVDQSLAAFGDS